MYELKHHSEEMYLVKKNYIKDPKILPNPKPSTLNPKSLTLNPKP
jgi:hypothetical protein